MSDIGRFTQMLADFGVVFIKDTKYDGLGIPIYHLVRVNSRPPLQDTIWIFDISGKFLNQGYENG